MKRTLFITVLFVVLIIFAGCAKLENKQTVVLTKVIEINNLGFITDSVIDNNVLYAVGSTGLHCMDVSKETPPVIGEVTSLVPFNDIAIQNNYAFVVSGQRRSPNGELKVFDISNPARLNEVASLILPEGPISITLDNNVAFIGDYSTGAILVDISNPLQPTILSTIKLGSDQFHSYEQVLSKVLKKYDLSTESELFSFIKKEYPAFVIDKNEAEIKEFITNLGVVGHSWWMRADENRLYLPYDGEGFFILDITDKTNPVVLGSFNKNCSDSNERCYFNDVEVKDNFAFIALDYGGLLVLDITNPKQPIEVTQVIPWKKDTWKNSKGHMITIKIKENYAFLTAGEDGVYVFDISTPQKPVLIQTISTDSLKGQKGCAWGSELNENRLFVGFAPCVAQNPIYGSLEIYSISKSV